VEDIKGEEGEKEDDETEDDYEEAQMKTYHADMQLGKLEEGVGKALWEEEDEGVIPWCDGLSCGTGEVLPASIPQQQVVGG